MKKISITMYGEPVPYKRPRFNGKFAYNDPIYAEYKRQFAKQIRACVGHLIVRAPLPGSKERSQFLNTNRYNLTVRAYRARNQGDVDNFLKCVQDALQDSGLIADDCQIDRIIAEKHIDRTAPRIEFTLEQTMVMESLPLVFGEVL